MVCARVDQWEWHIHVGNTLGNVRARLLYKGLYCIKTNKTRPNILLGFQTVSGCPYTA